MKYGLIGGTLAHSFSKQIHEQIADYQYELIPLEENEFHIFMKEKKFNAINVTIPYKKAVIPYLDKLDDTAKTIGAVNTIVNDHGCLIGYNTDYYGFEYMIKKYCVSLTGKKVLILGNGGASAAVQAVVKKYDIKDMIVVTKNGNNGAVNYQCVFQNHLDAEVIINTSPIGMYPHVDESPINLSLFHKCDTVLDIIYNPITTKLCIDAIRLGILAANGLEMLIAQAVYAVEYFKHTKLSERIIEDIYQELLLNKINLVLIGMPSCGKTTIGNKLAKRLNKQFIDMDDIIVKKQNLLIPDIFKEHGEAAFRCYETEASIMMSSYENCVIATGGGIVKYQVNMDYLKQNSIIIYMERDFDKLSYSDSSRPLSSSKEALLKLQEERLPLYQKYSDIIVENNQEIELVIDLIIQEIKQYLTHR